MKNNWQLQQDAANNEMVLEDFDDYGYGETHDVSIGDEVESDLNDYQQFGIVVGIIRDYTGSPACYKVWRTDDDCFDYIQAAQVTMHEACGSSEWSLGRIGYHKVETTGGGYYYNAETGDKILW